MKRIIGILFFVATALLILGGVLNDRFDFATMLVIGIYVLSGIFLLTFDNVYKKNYMYGFKKRGVQSKQILIFMISYVILMVFATIGASMSYTDNFMWSFIKGMLPYLIPELIFVYMYQIYAVPYNTSKKYFLNNDENINKYLSAGETFVAHSDDKKVLANNEAFFFPKLFCIVPFDQVESVTLKKNPFEQGVYFNLVNGKKFYILSREYDKILEAFNAYKNSRQ